LTGDAVNPTLHRVMADDDTSGESRWDRLRVRLISIALLVASVLFLFRADDWIRTALPNSDPSAMLAWFIPAAMTLTGAGLMLRKTWKVRRNPANPDEAAL
jgi:hypothetical protein